MSVSQVMLADATVWMQSLANIATAVAALSGATAPVQGEASDQAKAIAASLMSGERKAILLGNAAAHHPQASSLLNLANWIAKQCNASVGYLGESANTVGAQMVGAQPQANGLNAMQMITTSQLKAVFLLNTEPKLDTAYGEGQLSKADMVVTLSPFKTNLDISDVLLPISPFTETAGTFVNTEGRTQSFHGVVKPLAETRPAWKVLRVLGTMMHVPDFEFDTIEQVRAKALPSIVTELMSNESITPITTTPATSQPVSASIYQLDALVRRAPALQHTADAREVH
jgi:NADH-quinone oxidoreductase subunit G